MPTKASALFIFAHPDDEFFCTAFLADEVRESGNVHCFYLTDGAWQGQSAERRMKESTRVLAHYGVQPENIQFIGAAHAIPDGSLPAHMDRAYQAVLDAMTSTPDRIYTTAWEGGHQDHDACNAIAWRLAAERCNQQVFQFALYNGYRRSGPWFRVMTPLKENGHAEDRRMSAAEVLRSLLIAFWFPSQWKTWMGLLPFAAWRLLIQRRMTRQTVTRQRLRERPHAGALLYERRGHATFEAVSERIHAFLRD